MRRFSLSNLLSLIPHSFWLLGMSILVSLFFLVPHLPSFSPVPFIDAAVFLYIGWQWNEGLLPYRDLWDHKPPLIYLIDAIGYRLTGGQAGAWLIETILITFSFFLLVYLLYHQYGKKAVIALLPAFWAPFQYTYIRNMTENIALPWQVGLLYLASIPQWQLPHFALLGSTTAFLLMSRPNIALGGLFLFGYALRYRGTRERWKSFGIWLLSLLSIWFPFLLYMKKHHALQAFWDAVVVFNLSYHQAGFSKTWWEIFVQLLYFLPPWIIWMVLLSVSVAFYSSEKSQKNFFIPYIGLLVADIIAVALPRRAVVHYAMNLVPIFAFWSAYGLIFVFKHWRSVALSHKALTASMLFASLWLALVPKTSLWWIQTKKYQHHEYVNASQFIQRYTKPTETSFLWGEIRVNVLARRRTPTRYVVFPPSYAPNYEQHLERLLSDLERNKPIFIVDTFKRGISIWDLWNEQPDLAQRANRLRERYIPIHQIRVGKRDWIFYILKSEAERLK